MRKLLILLVILLALGGYWVYWHKQADGLRAMLAQSIAGVNDQYKRLNQDSPVIRYEAINASGFPLRVTLEIVKPVVDLPVSAILKSLPPARDAAPAMAAPAPPENWVEEVSYGQSITLSGNMRGDHFTLTMDGDRTSVSMIDNAVRHTLVSSTSSPVVCHLALGRKSAAPWSREPLFTDIPTFLAAFRSLDCATGGVTLKNAIDGALLFSLKDFSISLSARPGSGSDRTLAFAAHAKAAKATPAYDSLAAEYAQRADTLLHMPVQPMMPLSAYGEQNINVDMRYDGPTDRRALSDPDMHLKLDVNAFDMESALINMHSQLHIDTQPDGADRVASVVMHDRLQVSERYDQLAAAQAADLAGRLQAMQAAQKTAAPAVAPQALVDLMPRLHDLGDIAWDVDVSAKGRNRADAFLKQGSVTLSAFDLVATPYGLKLKGNAASKQGKMPSGELVATCLSCDALVKGAVTYANRFKAALAGPAQSVPFPPAFTDGVQRFLRAISENGSDAKAKDWVIRLRAKDTGEITISGKQIAEVLGLYITDVAPHLPHPAAQEATPDAGAKH